MGIQDSFRVFTARSLCSLKTQRTQRSSFYFSLRWLKIKGSSPLGSLFKTVNPNFSKVIYRPHFTNKALEAQKTKVDMVMISYGASTMICNKLVPFYYLCRNIYGLKRDPKGLCNISKCF